MIVPNTVMTLPFPFSGRGKAQRTKATSVNAYQELCDVLGLVFPSCELRFAPLLALRPG